MLIIKKIVKLHNILVEERVFVILAFLWIILLAGGTLVYNFDAESKTTNIKSIYDAFYWAWVTMTTVGYGDFSPQTPAAKLIASIMMFFSLLLISFLTATISSLFIARKIQEGKGLTSIKAQNHYVICGWNNQSESLLTTFLQQSGEKSMQVVLINEEPEDEIQNIINKFKPHKFNFVKGDFTNDVILYRAQVDKASAVLVLPYLSKLGASEVDEKTALAVYSIKALAPKVKVYAYLLFKDSRSSVKRAKVDGIIISDEFGPFLGASQLLQPGLPPFLTEMFHGETSHMLSEPVKSAFVGKLFSDVFSHYQTKEKKIVLGIYREEKSDGISGFLSPDSGDYLDAFIQRKLREAGRTMGDEQKIKTILNPADDYVITNRDHLIIFS
jgi:voltage-gated potassium channel